MGAPWKSKYCQFNYLIFVLHFIFIFVFYFCVLFLYFIIIFSPFGAGLEEDQCFMLLATVQKKALRNRENQVSAVFWAPTFGTLTQRMVNWDSEAGCPPEQWFLQDLVAFKSG